MLQNTLIGLGGGAAGALLFASVSSGSWLSVLLFYLAPLPMMIAGIGWSHWAAMAGALAGAFTLGAAFSSLFFFAFLAVAGLPAWWLSYLAMLARPRAETSAAAGLEWYPPGRLVFWASLLAMLVVLAALPMFGLTGEAFRRGMREALTHMFRIETNTAPNAPLVIPGVADPERVIDTLAVAVPLAAAAIATLTNAVNLWLAGRVVKLSGRLARPWPVLADMRLPVAAAPALLAAAALSFSGGLLGVAAGVAAASLLMAYGFVGFAVLHAITAGLPTRGMILGAAYASVFLIGWPMLGACALGLIDTVVDLRGRTARKRAGGDPGQRG
ncbi:MAG: hypothetical protein IRY89_10415 [Pseudolabrys sp.]|nr:hypothetical protein [Pseudolabrys sp.]